MSIPGTPDDDYPILSQPPDTAFSCSGKVNGGYYADPEARCQSFHICAGQFYNGLTKFSFLCPNGTLFQQLTFVCDWWFNVDCSKSLEFYNLNEDLEDARETSSNAKRHSRRVEDVFYASIRRKKETTHAKGINNLQLIDDKSLNKFQGSDTGSSSFDLTHLLYGPPYDSNAQSEDQIYGFDPRLHPEYSLPYRDLEFGYTNFAKEVKSTLSPQELLQKLVSINDNLKEDEI